MVCSSCAAKAKKQATKVEGKLVKTEPTATQNVKKIPADMKEEDMLYAPKSADPSKKVKLTYNGGGTSKKKSVGCSSCHAGRATYSVTTTETIVFVSEDAQNMIYKETVSVGHSYYVTEEQAKVMLSLTYMDKSGQRVHKFTKGD